MIDKAYIAQIVEEHLSEGELFLIDVDCTADNNLEVVIDSDKSVDVESCVALSQWLESQIDREKEDFQLSVLSAGVGQPLKKLRQYQKLIGTSVEVLLKNGTKILATLTDADNESITICYKEKRIEQGKKRKVEVEVNQRYPLSEVKATKEWLDFK